MTLYHGSYTIVDHPDLDHSRPNVDFGKGFYLTDIRSQADHMAVRRTRIAGFGKPCVTAYAFDDALLKAGNLNVKVFSDMPTEEWAEFIDANRHSSETGFSHTYDIVVGPVADDGVAFQLERYHERAIDLKTLAHELAYRKLNRQYYFGTERAIAELKRL